MRTSQVLSILICALVICANGICQTQTAAQKPLTIPIPGESWMLEIDAPDFSVEQDSVREGQKYLMATNKETNMVLSVSLERVSGQANMEECRSSLQKRTTGDGPFKITNVRTRDVGAIPVVEFLIPEAQRVKPPTEVPPQCVSF